MPKSSSKRRSSKTAAPAPSALGRMVRRLIGGLFEPELPVTEYRGRGKCDTEVAGVKHFQADLEAICGGRTARSQKLPVTALLRPDAEGESMRVFVQGREVGQLKPKDVRFLGKQLDQADLEPCALKVPALIVGGKLKRGGETEDFGVRVCLPPRPEKKAASDEGVV